MRTPRINPRGFSLIELLIVIAIIALLIGILLPAISRIRESGRSTVCLANLQQWGVIYQMYMSANHGRSLPESQYPAWRTPWQELEPYSKTNSASMRCPSASEPKSWTLPPEDAGGFTGIRGSASHAWYWKTTWGSSIGSYAFNDALIDPGGAKRTVHFHFPVKDSAQIPAFADCIFPNVVIGGDYPPTDLESPDMSSGISDCCINRHRMAVNVVFLDGHGEHVRLAALWSLQWRVGYMPHAVVIPGS